MIAFLYRALKSKLRLDLLVSSSDVVLGKLEVSVRSFGTRTPWTGVSAGDHAQHTGPSNNETGLVIGFRLRDHVEVNMVYLLVGNAAVVLANQR